MLGDSLESIVADYSATFYETPNITTVKFGKGMKEINNAFGGQANLTTVVLGDSIKVIGNSAFNGCAALKSINIPNTARTIGDYAFAGCTALTNITLPDSLQTYCGSTSVE